MRRPPQVNATRQFGEHRERCADDFARDGQNRCEGTPLDEKRPLHVLDKALLRLRGTILSVRHSLSSLFEIISTVNMWFMHSIWQFTLFTLLVASSFSATTALSFGPPIVLDTGRPAVRPRIAGGTLTETGDAPWYISPTGSTFCGASLIYEDVGLTAAHCGEAFFPGAAVYVGSVSRGTGDRPRRVRRVLSHPLWRSTSVTVEEGQQRPTTSHPIYDVMLFSLEEPVTDVTPISYNTDPDQPPAGESLRVLGFGKTAADADPTLHLREAAVLATDSGTCQSIYRNLYTDGLTLCAGDPDNPVGACQGDSGGPLVSTVDVNVDAAAPVVQYGVVAYGLAGTPEEPVDSCGNPDVPTAYTRTSAVSDWIQAGICALSNNSPTAICENLPDDIVLPSLAPTPVTSAPTPAPQTADLTFVVQYDGQPDETDFYIVQTSDNNNMDEPVVARRPTGQTVNPRARFAYNIQDVPHGSYALIVTDAGGDGWTNGPIPGSVDVFQFDNRGRPVLIAYADGSTRQEFATILEIPFVVTEPVAVVLKPTAQPTAAPTQAPTTRTREPSAVNNNPTPTNGNDGQPPSQPSASDTDGGPTFTFQDNSTSRDGDTNDGKDNDNTDNDEVDDGNDLLGLGLNDGTNFAIILAAALFVFLVFILLVRCLCCDTTKAPRGRQDEFLPP